MFFTLLIPLALFRVKNITAYLFFAALAPSVFSVGKGEGYRDTYIEFATTGTHSVMITFKYSDTVGNVYTTHTDIFQVNVVENAEDVTQQQSVENQDATATAGLPFNIAIWQICLIAGIIVVIIIIIVLLRKDRH